MAVKAAARVRSKAAESIVSIRGVSKIYQPGSKSAIEALKHIDLEIPRGSIFGLLGPNGAGKSTLINILGGLTIKTQGEVVIAGYDIDRDPRNARGVIGIVPQELNMDPFFTPRQSLELIAGLYGVKKSGRRTDEILRAVGLTDKADSYARRLSGGMQRRLLVAKAMVHSPEVLVLDEPTAGVDITLRKQLWDYVHEINRKHKTTILLTTHYLEEAEQMCDRIAIIDHGKLIADESKQDMLNLVDAKSLEVTFAKPLKAIPASLKKFDTRKKSSNILVINYHQKTASAGEIISLLQKEKIDITEITTHEADLEKVFLNLTQENVK